MVRRTGRQRQPTEETGTEGDRAAGQAQDRLPRDATWFSCTGPIRRAMRESASNGAAPSSTSRRTHTRWVRPAALISHRSMGESGAPIGSRSLSCPNGICSASSRAPLPRLTGGAPIGRVAWPGRSFAQPSCRPGECAPGMKACPVLPLAHLLLRTHAVRETARPLSDHVQVAHTLSSPCTGEGQGRWRVGARGLGHRIVRVSGGWVV
jgi:hypothetical protein